MLKKLLDQLGNELGLEPINGAHEEQHYLFSVNNIEIEANELKRSYLLKGTIGEVPPENVDAFLMKIMEANLFGLGTRGAAIGLNEEGKVLTLSLELEYNTSYKEFKEKIEDFISVRHFWQSEALNHK